MSERAITTVRRSTARAASTGTATSSAAAAEITAEQERAIGLMASGKTAKEAAAGAGISRATLYRWLRDDPAFVAAWNAWQRDQRQATRSQLLSMSGEAVDAVRAAVQKGDGRLALAMLKAMGPLTEQPVGSEEAELVGKELNLARREEVLNVRKREFDVMLEELG